MDLQRGIIALLSQLLDLLCHHCKALARFPGSCSLDGSIQCQHIGLIGDAADQIDGLGDSADGSVGILDLTGNIADVIGGLVRALLHGIDKVRRIVIGLLHLLGGPAQGIHSAHNIVDVIAHDADLRIHLLHILCHLSGAQGQLIHCSGDSSGGFLTGAEHFVHIIRGMGNKGNLFPNVPHCLGQLALKSLGGITDLAKLIQDHVIGKLCAQIAICHALNSTYKSVALLVQENSQQTDKYKAKHYDCHRNSHSGQIGAPHTIVNPIHGKIHQKSQIIFRQALYRHNALFAVNLIKILNGGSALQKPGDQLYMDFLLHRCTAHISLVVGQYIDVLPAVRKNKGSPHQLTVLYIRQITCQLRQEGAAADQTDGLSRIIINGLSQIQDHLSGSRRDKGPSIKKSIRMICHGCTVRRKIIPLSGLHPHYRRCGVYLHYGIPVAGVNSLPS